MILRVHLNIHHTRRKSVTESGICEFLYHSRDWNFFLLILNLIAISKYLNYPTAFNSTQTTGKNRSIQQPKNKGEDGCGVQWQRRKNMTHINVLRAHTWSTPNLYANEQISAHFIYVFNRIK